MNINYYEMSRIPTADAKDVLATIEDDEWYGGSKRILNNLNITERVLRRKVKNRIAAQTARDRKKAHMDNLEANVKRIERENKFLRECNEKLRSQVHQLVKSNLELKSTLDLTSQTSPPLDYLCVSTPLQKDEYQIITPSLSDQDQYVNVTKSDGFTLKRSQPAVQYNSLNACFINNDVRSDTHTELLLDVVGDNEPIELVRSECKYVCATTRLPKHVEETEQSYSSSESLFKSSKLVYEEISVKREELDADDLISNHSNKVTCRTSPGSQPLSPLLRDVGTNGIKVRELCDEPELSVARNAPVNGYMICHQPGSEREFTNVCNANIIHDPFSDLFPSLISV